LFQAWKCISSWCKLCVMSTTILWLSNLWIAFESSG
jgi:hypothetical protein